MRRPESQPRRGRGRWQKAKLGHSMNQTWGEERDYPILSLRLKPPPDSESHKAAQIVGSRETEAQVLSSAQAAVNSLHISSGRLLNLPCRRHNIMDGGVWGVCVFVSPRAEEVVSCGIRADRWICYRYPSALVLSTVHLFSPSTLQLC